MLGEDEKFAEEGFGEKKVGERLDLGKWVSGVFESWGEESLSDGRELSKQNENESRSAFERKPFASNCVDEVKV